MDFAGKPSFGLAFFRLGLAFLLFQAHLQTSRAFESGFCRIFSIRNVLLLRRGCRRHHSKMAYRQERAAVVYFVPSDSGCAFCFKFAAFP